MKIFHFEARLWLPRPRNEVFEFFSNAINLEELTPSSLRFHVLTPTPIRVQQDLEIDYRLKIRGIPVRWRSKITVWDPPNSFVDEQVRGPYRLWIHEHRFTEQEGGTICEDSLQYAPSAARSSTNCSWPVKSPKFSPIDPSVFSISSRTSWRLLHSDRPLPRPSADNSLKHVPASPFSQPTSPTIISKTAGRFFSPLRSCEAFRRLRESIGGETESQPGRSSRHDRLPQNERPRVRWHGPR